MKKVLTLSEAAETLRLSRPTVLKLLREGQLPGARLGAQWRISAEAIERMVEGGGGVVESESELPKAA